MSERARGTSDVYYLLCAEVHLDSERNSISRMENAEGALNSYSPHPHPCPRQIETLLAYLLSPKSYLPMHCSRLKARVKIWRTCPSILSALRFFLPPVKDAGLRSQALKSADSEHLSAHLHSTDKGSSNRRVGETGNR